LLEVRSEKLEMVVVCYLRVKLYAVLANKNTSHYSLLISL